MANLAPQRHTKTAGEVRNLSIDMQGLLDEGELLTGTPTIVEVTTTHLTITNKAVSSEALMINGIECPIGQAMQCTIAGGTAGHTYSIRFTVGTDAGQTLIVTASLRVIED